MDERIEALAMKLLLAKNNCKARQTCDGCNYSNINDAKLCEALLMAEELLKYYKPIDEQKTCVYEQKKELDFVWWECSECGSGFNFYANTPYESRLHYCPYCGAKIAECKELQNG